jgi:hypothetical protein
MRKKKANEQFSLVGLDGRDDSKRNMGIYW